MELKVFIYIFVGIGIFFALPSTVYTAMFFGIFYRRKSILLEKDDLTKTQYFPVAERLKTDILYAKSLPFERVTLQAADGVTLLGRYYNCNTNKAIIFVHGYQSNAFNNFAAAMVDFLNCGYSVLLVDQRAHGESGGKFTTLGDREKGDLLLWIDYLSAKAELNNIVVYGISMGATTVGLTAENIKTDKVKCLIMEAGFTCFYDELVSSLGAVFMKQAALNYIYLMSKSVLKADIKKSVEPSLKNNKIPVLFLHGDIDKEVSMDFTDRMYNACAADKQKITVTGAGHTLCYVIGGAVLHQQIHKFLDKFICKSENKEVQND